jgi:DNA damage-inducible protein 1
MTVAELKALVEAETNAPAAAQLLSQDGSPLMDDSKSLTQLNVKESDLLGLAVQVERSAPRQQQAQPQSQNSGPSAEQFRQAMLSQSQFLERVRQENPQLAAAVNDPRRFAQLFSNLQNELLQRQRQAEAEMARLDDDMYSADAQREIENRIRQQQIAKNIERAMEENPESFARVSMLYVDVTVNDVPIKAFVDSGAQTTIMSPDAARRCNITHLIDERYGGIARGVGTAKILGRVHSAYMMLGGFQAASSFTVMEGKDVDLLLGLDMLKRHQMCIDLKENCLRVQDTKIPFLPEHQIPKMMEEVLENEPKVAGPGGTTIGTTTGTVEPAPQAPSSSSSQPAPAAAALTSQPPRAPQQQSQASSVASSSQPQQRSTHSEESINAVMNFGGVSRAEAVGLLEQAGGNVDLALGLLF